MNEKMPWPLWLTSARLSRIPVTQHGPDFSGGHPVPLPITCIWGSTRTRLNPWNGQGHVSLRAALRLPVVVLEQKVPGLPSGVGVLFLVWSSMFCNICP